MPQENRKIRSPTPFVYLVAAVSVLLFLAAPVSAHAPTGMILSYNETAQELSVTITHIVTDNTTHYVKEVKISKNGQVVTDSLYTTQPTKDTFTYVYTLPANPGDNIEVTASCVIAGSITRTIGGNGPVSPAQTPKAGIGIAPVISIAGLFILRRFR